MTDWDWNWLWVIGEAGVSFGFYCLWKSNAGFANAIEV